jgi:pyruvate/2-oxoacid:ferredoxin oxidoreductase alpha subunit
MINMDAFYLTHTSEAVQLPDQKAVDAFIPKRIKPVLNSDQPVTFGNVCGADLYTSLRYIRHHDTNAALEVWQNASDDYAKTFGRSCPPLQTYKTEDADTILVVAGSAAGTLRLTADQLREQGHAVGVMRLAMVRPFPAGLIAQTVSAAKRVIVVERGISNGMGGIIGQELKAGLFGSRNGLEVWSLFAGLGGKDIVPEEIASEVKSILAGEKANEAQNDNSIWTGLLS